MPTDSMQRQLFQAIAEGGTRPPRIEANIKRLDNRFPGLGFTINTGDLPYFEVLLTTDRKYFSPAQAAGRSESNWYASRQDSGIIRATGDHNVYLVPTSVLRSFANAQPHPNAIYYTVVGYRGPDGSGPVFSQPPETLATSGQYVALSSDYRAQTLATVMGISSDKLSVVRASAEPEPGHEDDIGEGEDGYDFLGTAEPSESAGSPPVLAADSDFEYEDGWGDWETASQSQASSGSRPGSIAQDDYAYSDGFEDSLGAVDGWNPGAASNGPPALAEPAQLEDDDYQDEYAYEEIGTEYPEAQSWSLSGYGDEAESWSGAPSPVAKTADVELTPTAKRDILEQIIHFEAGRANPYAAINPDGEFEGRFPNHEAAGRYHIGLSYGVVQFTQDSQNLGRLLSLMQQRNPETFSQIFGEQTEELLRVTNAPGPSSKDSPGGRSARVQPVGGADLWREPWLSRFAQAGSVPEFQAAQLQLASDLFIDPMLRFAGWLGLNTDRALAMVVDRAVQMGVGGARRWIMEAIGPIQSVAQRQQALAALGATDLRSFQAMHAELDQDGVWGPMTHAAMVEGLRGLNGTSPVPVPTRDQMLDAMVRRAANSSFARRVSQLRTSPEFQDVVYQLN